MKRMLKAMTRKLFGASCERLIRTAAVCLMVFLGLRAAELSIRIAVPVLYLMVSSVSAGLMWQALAAAGGGRDMSHMLMLPFEEPDFVCSYVAVLGAYTLLTRTAVVLSAALAVSPCGVGSLLGCVLCAANAVLVSACAYSREKPRDMALCALAALAVFLLAIGTELLFPVLTGSCLAAVLLLLRTDAYAFCSRQGKRRRRIGSGRRCLVWRYLFRYLAAHKNYLVNTVALLGVACVLPALFGQMESRFVLPVGFAILSLNTPIGILLSCDPGLERALRVLPGQKKAFCIPYGLFIFACSLSADAVYLCSWQLQNGGIGAGAVAWAALFAALGAGGTVLLEWYFPICAWRIESDLWHHPRKYVIPAALLLLAGLAGMG